MAQITRNDDRIGIPGFRGNLGHEAHLDARSLIIETGLGDFGRTNALDFGPYRLATIRPLVDRSGVSVENLGGQERFEGLAVARGKGLDDHCISAASALNEGVRVKARVSRCDRFQACGGRSFKGGAQSRRAACIAGLCHFLRRRRSLHVTFPSPQDRIKAVSEEDRDHTAEKCPDIHTARYTFAALTSPGATRQSLVPSPDIGPICPVVSLFAVVLPACRWTVAMLTGALSLTRPPTASRLQTHPGSSMTDAPNMPADDAAAQQPQLRVLAQYVKDLSFENPGAPDTLRPGQATPAIDLGIDVQARAVGEDTYEVVLTVNAKASREETVVFIAELAYAGLFQLANVQDAEREPFLLIECPRLIFPFARRVLGDTTRDGNFPPLMLDPVDFAGLYRAQLAKRAAAVPGSEGNSNGNGDPAAAN